MWACYFHRRAIDAAFVGPLPAERWASLRTHIEGCAACREHYEKLGPVGRAPGPGGAAPLMRETLADVVVGEGTGRRARRVPWFAGIGFAVAAAAAFLLFLRPRPADDLRPRGGQTSPGRPPGVRLLCVADGRVLGEVVATATAG